MGFKQYSDFSTEFNTFSELISARFVAQDFEPESPFWLKDLPKVSSRKVDGLMPLSTRGLWSAMARGRQVRSIYISGKISLWASSLAIVVRCVAQNILRPRLRTPAQ